MAHCLSQYNIWYRKIKIKQKDINDYLEFIEKIFKLCK